MRHSFPHFFYSKMNCPITRKEQNEKPFFLYFFQRFKTHFFDFDKSQFFSNFNEVIRFINTQEGKHFFQNFFFDRKPQHMCI